jgi:hypothetical protein
MLAITPDNRVVANDIRRISATRKKALPFVPGAPGRSLASGVLLSFDIIVSHLNCGSSAGPERVFSAPRVHDSLWGPQRKPTTIERVIALLGNPSDEADLPVAVVSWLARPLMAAFPLNRHSTRYLESSRMAKPHRQLKKANHGARPANSKARKMKRKHIKT